MGNITSQFLAAASSDEIFKSMSETMNSDINPLQIVSVIAALVGLIVLITLFSRRESKPVTPKVLNNSGKLTRELARAIGLKRREYKRLKQLAEQQGVEHAMTLLLCPSLLKRSLQAEPDAKLAVDAVVSALVDNDPTKP